MTAFDTAWDILKFRIPDISERSYRERENKEDWETINKPFLWDGQRKDRVNPFPHSPKPENYGSSPTIQGQDFQRYDWRMPQAMGVSTNQGTSFINAGRIISDIIGWPLNERIPLDDEYKMTDEQIEDAIKQMAETGRHEAVHDILSVIFPYEGLRRWGDDDEARQWQLAHEYGAHAGQYDTRLGALRGMARHPHFSEGGWDDEYAPMRNPHRQRLTDIYDETREAREGMSREESDAFVEQFLAEIQGRRARENAAARGGSAEMMP